MLSQTHGDGVTLVQLAADVAIRQGNRLTVDGERLADHHGLTPGYTGRGDLAAFRQRGRIGLAERVNRRGLGDCHSNDAACDDGQ